MNEFTVKDLEELLKSVCTVEVELTQEKLKQLPPHHFSRAFEKKMKWLFWRRALRYDTILNSTGKKVAALLLCFLLASTTTVLSVEAWRNELFQLIQKVYDYCTDITFEGNTSEDFTDEPFVAYQITALPEGFSLVEEQVFPEVYNSVKKYQNEEMYLYFEQALASSSNFFVDSEGGQTEIIQYNGIEYLACINKGRQYLAWTKDQYAFLLRSNVLMDQLLVIADSVKKPSD